MESRTSVEVGLEPPEGAFAPFGTVRNPLSAGRSRLDRKTRDRQDDAIGISDFHRGCGSLAVPRSAHMGLVTMLLSRRRQRHTAALPTGETHDVR